jgi:hypothetical protein
VVLVRNARHFPGVASTSRSHTHALVQVTQDACVSHVADIFLMDGGYLILRICFFLIACTSTCSWPRRSEEI